MKRERFAELDALRGFAALAVVIYHYLGHAARYFHDIPTFPIGRYGVQLFFCVSGFVIFWTLQRSTSVADFAFSRFTRLYPAYWAALALCLIVSFVIRGEPLWVTGYAVNATMLQTFVGVPDVDIVFWTLAIELTFYIGMAGVYCAKQLDRMPWIALGCLAFSGVAIFLDAPDSIDHFFVARPAFLTDAASSIPYFMSGTMFFLISRDGWKRGYVAVIGCALVVAGLRGWQELAVAAFVFSVFAAAIAGRLRLLVNPVTTWLGAISYTLYLTHRNLGYEVLFALNHKGWPSWVSVLLTLATALAIASAITYFIERPSMEWLRGRWKQLRATSTITARANCAAQ